MVSHAVLVEFVRLKSPHTGENIRQLTEEVLDKYNIKDKVYKIVTDNASSMIKAYKFGLFPDEEANECEDGIIATQNTQNLSDDLDHDIEMNTFQAINVDSDNDEDFEDQMGTRLSCFAHSLQLCVRDGLKNSTYTTRALGKCQSLAKSSHKSSKVADYLEEKNKHVNKMNVTRW
ncbi:unnamed protein product, partial [Adineta ricciae]